MTTSTGYKFGFNNRIAIAALRMNLREIGKRSTGYYQLYWSKLRYQYGMYF